MRAYTYQIGGGTGSDITTLIHSEAIFADSLLEAIDKAKAVTNARPVSDAEDTVCLLDEMNAEAEPVWIRPIKDVRAA
ncbi:hypothetical protein [Lichenihabitans psoromatis]|uniref:hypothetical protein n=1 Tax=Lichenihabitans psoromatis TaxID=2528642 RepID=UPI0010355276|nr:hypothetical protein [Lichenihabitans psoromatis]